MNDRKCFVTHFLICLAVFTAFFYCWRLGLVQDTFRSDVSYMTSVTAALVLIAMVVLGKQAWSVDRDTEPHAGVFIIGICPLVGLLGTSTGLRENVKTLVAGTSGLIPLSTAIQTMQVGILGLLIVALLVFNLDAGARRAR
jgi:hypothetical protein